MILGVWLVLGQLWLSLIFAHVAHVGLSTKKGLKARASLKVAGIDAALIWGTSLIPFLGAWVYKPVVFVLYFVVMVICRIVGVELGDANG